MRIYSGTFENVTVSASQDLFELAPATNKPCAVHGVKLCNVGGTSDAGDAQEELLRLLFRRGHTTSGSGGTTVTARPLKPADAAAGATLEANNTTVATVGTTHDMDADGWNVRIPYLWLPPPELRTIVSAAETTFVVRLLSTPADALSVSGTIWFEELA